MQSPIDLISPKEKKNQAHNKNILLNHKTLLRWHNSDSYNYYMNNLHLRVHNKGMSLVTNIQFVKMVMYYHYYSILLTIKINKHSEAWEWEEKKTEEYFLTLKLILPN